MIIQNFGYHTHSTYSDGKNSLKDMVEQAVALGWTEIGFSDHLIVHKNIKNSPSWPTLKNHYASYIYRDNFAEAINVFKDYKAEIIELRKHYPIKIYIGAEVDYFRYEGWIDEFINFMNELNLDYYINGNHYLFDDDNILIDPDDFDRLVPDVNKQKRIVSRHFETIGIAAQSGLFNFIAHIDYMRRLKICSNDAFYDDKMNLISILGSTQTPVEISSKGFIKFGEAFPCKWILEEMNKQNIPLVISDDAHNTARIGENFDVIEELLNKLNYKNRWKLNRG